MNVSIKQISELFKNDLASIYENTELNQIVFMCLEHVLEIDRVKILAYPDLNIEESKYEALKNLLEKLKTREPVQYVLGKTEFYELAFKVDASVLIPRPETEELVHWIIKDNQIQNPKIMDVGSGSGCIPISLKKHMPTAEVYATDISEKALHLAQENAAINTCEINLFHADILTISHKQLPQSLDILVSNPPYVKKSEMERMQGNVLDYEPHLALFVENNKPLLFYDTIADVGLSCLKKGGLLYFEINEALGYETKVLLENKGYKNVEVRKDLYGKDRMLKAVH